ncbi:MAG: hypothetical protein JKY32_08035 [Rhizobiales bacterium]|nr:hypothetical protein [Hyphomicrobiales bacterium]
MTPVLCNSLPIPLSDDGSEKIVKWIHLLPADGVSTSDNRGPYHIKDMAEVIATSLNQADGRLPIDENHSTDLAAPKGAPSPARGWIVELKTEDDGLWGKVEWSTEGAKLMAEKAYRFISPVITHLKDKTITSILRAALTNTPNLRGLAALNSEKPMDILEQIRKLLGIKDDAGDKTVLAAVTALQAKSEGGDNSDTIETALQAALDPIATAAGLKAGATGADILGKIKDLADPAKWVKADVVKELQSQMTALTDGVGKDKAELCVDAAIKDGKPGVKSLRDHYIARHMKEPDAVAKELDAMPSLTAETLARTSPPDKDGNVALNSAQANAARLLGISAEDYQKTLADEAKQLEVL